MSKVSPSMGWTCKSQPSSISELPLNDWPYTRLSADLEDPQVTYNPVKSKTLAKLFPAISFPNYFASFTPRPYYPDPVVVASPNYLSNVTALLERTDPTTLEAYFVIRAAQEVRVHWACRVSLKLTSFCVGFARSHPSLERNNPCIVPSATWRTL